MTVTSEVKKKKGKMKNNLKEWSLFITRKVVGRFLLCCNKIDLIPPSQGSVLIFLCTPLILC